MCWIRPAGKSAARIWPGLAGAPFDVHTGHDAERIDASLDLLVHSDAVPADNPELMRADELGMRVDELSADAGPADGIAARRGHRRHARQDRRRRRWPAKSWSPPDSIPRSSCGAAPIGALAAAGIGRGRWMVAEACEYRGNFQHLNPELAAILGIEPDHFDCFASQARA